MVEKLVLAALTNGWNALFLIVKFEYLVDRPNNEFIIMQGVKWFIALHDDILSVLKKMRWSYNSTTYPLERSLSIFLTKCSFDLHASIDLPHFQHAQNTDPLNMRIALWLKA